MPHFMGNLKDLITTIEHTARGQIQDKKSKVEEQAEQILEEAREQADQIRQEIIDRAGEEAEQKQRRQLAEALQTAQHDYLLAREELLDQVWQQAEAELRALTDDADAYGEVLGRLAGMAAQSLGAGQFILAADPKGHELLTKSRLKHWGQAAEAAGDEAVSFERAGEPLETWGGMLIKQKDSRRQIDATFPTRLNLARDEFRDTIFKRLGQDK